ncbi:DUF3017 domain-containing protein [Nonomuraea dietziae]|uniref:DUF3017 domain-containing protein n=1 Tax=Nonomuraea dietziae TaxID=65515 RepID=A0A7W5V173_9ACTN|nr:DUF3017 domain-containing protein [Nonomuraea dietziae]MBB3728487.1 hypothetical protein [Nonomuraea dietziae]
MNRTAERWGPYPLVMAGAVLGVLAIFLVDAEWGGFALGAVLLVAAAVRFAGYGGALAVRTKNVDAPTVAVLGAALVVTALFLEYPDLKAQLLALFGR